MHVMSWATGPLISKHACTRNLKFHSGASCKEAPNSKQSPITNYLNVPKHYCLSTTQSFEFENFEHWDLFGISITRTGGYP